MAEQFTNSGYTTLDGGIDNAVTTITITALPSGLTNTGQVRGIVDDEIIIFPLPPVGLVFSNCTRGAEGSTPQAHNDLAEVFLQLTAGQCDQFAQVTGGQLGGTGQAADVRGLRETGEPTLLTMGPVGPWQRLVRDGSNQVVGETFAVDAQLQVLRSQLEALVLCLSYQGVALPADFLLNNPYDIPGLFSVFGFEQQVNKGKINGYASLDSTGLVPVAQLPTTTTQNAFDARLQRDSTTQISLQRYKGQYVTVNGERVDVGSSGLPLTTSDNLLSSTGTNSGTVMTTSTLYYVYVSNSLATYVPSSLRASTTAPSLLSGVKSLGTTGNAANWRFVGWVRTNSSTQFVNDTTDRLVINYYNRWWLPVLLCPAYADDNVVTTYTTTSTSYTPANSGTGATCSYIANGEDDVFLQAVLGLAGNSGAAGAGADLAVSTPDSTTTAYAATRSVNYGAGTSQPASVATYNAIPAEGYHTQSLLVRVGSGTGTYFADIQRNGSVSDPRCVTLEGWVMG